jgi:hypothetical protein
VCGGKVLFLASDVDEHKMEELQSDIEKRLLEGKLKVPIEP